MRTFGFKGTALRMSRYSSSDDLNRVVTSSAVGGSERMSFPPPPFFGRVGRRERFSPGWFPFLAKTSKESESPYACVMTVVLFLDPYRGLIGHKTYRAKNISIGRKISLG